MRTTIIVCMLLLLAGPTLAQDRQWSISGVFSPISGGVAATDGHFNEPSGFMEGVEGEIRWGWRYFGVGLGVGYGHSGARSNHVTHDYANPLHLFRVPLMLYGRIPIGDGALRFAGELGYAAGVAGQYDDETVGLSGLTAGFLIGYTAPVADAWWLTIDGGARLSRLDLDHEGSYLQAEMHHLSFPLRVGMARAF